MKKIHFTDRYLLNPRHPVTVFVIGAGGTGSQAVSYTHLDVYKRQLVEDMKRKNGELFSSLVTMDKVTGGLQYTRHNPETGEIYIPKEICSVQDVYKRQYASKNIKNVCIIRGTAINRICSGFTRIVSP